MHAHAVGAPDGDDGIGDFQHETGAVFDRAAVVVGAVIGGVLEKLVDEIAVRAVDLDAVEARGLGVFRALPIGLDDGRDFLERQRARRDEVLHRAHQADVPGGPDRAGGNRQLAIQIERIGNAADMPELEQDSPAGIMHGAGDGFPALDLLVRPDARRVRIADAHRGHGGGFGEDQAEGGALGVILGHQRVRHAPGGGPATGERCHHDAVWKSEGSGLERLEKWIGHGWKLGVGVPAVSEIGRRTVSFTRNPQPATGNELELSRRISLHSPPGTT